MLSSSARVLLDLGKTRDSEFKKYKLLLLSMQGSYIPGGHSMQASLEHKACYSLCKDMIRIVYIQ